MHGKMCPQATKPAVARATDVENHVRENSSHSHPQQAAAASLLATQ